MIMAHPIKAIQHHGDAIPNHCQKSMAKIQPSPMSVISIHLERCVLDALLCLKLTIVFRSVNISNIPKAIKP